MADGILQVTWMIIFAAWAVAQVVIDQDLIKFSDKDRGFIFGEANKIVYVRKFKLLGCLTTCLKICRSTGPQSG